jgi:serine/threonine protein kinase
VENSSDSTSFLRQADLLRAVDRLCSEFRRKWQTDKTPPDLRRHLAEQFSDDPAAVIYLAIELVCIDMRYRWTDSYTKQVDSLSGLSASKVVGTRPSADDYCEWLFKRPANETPLRWIECEAQIRRQRGETDVDASLIARYGDRVDVLDRLVETTGFSSVATHADSPSEFATQVDKGALTTHHPVEGDNESDDESKGEFDTREDHRSDALFRIPAELELNSERFQFQERLGRGAFGEVWKAFDSHLKRMVAIKFPNDSFLDGSLRERFLRESQAAAKLNHEGIVSVFDVCLTPGGLPVIVSRFIDGISLAEAIKREKLIGVHEAARMGADLADALLHAHLEGIVHRDLKPANILIDGLGKPIIADFGLAKDLQHTELVTQEGDLLGTAAYMAPEQAALRSNEADPRSDIYSMGVVLYEMVTGERPFRGTLKMVLQQVINDAPIPPQRLNSGVPRDLQTIILRCMEKSPEYRYQSAAELRDDLLRFLCFEPIHAKPPNVIERFIKWYPAHATEMLGTYFIVAAMTWVFYIAGGLFETTERTGYQLSSPVFLPWAASWILVGSMIVTRGFWFELLNIPVLLAFLLLPFWLNDSAQGISLIGLIGFFGLCLQIGAIWGRVMRQGYVSQAGLESRLSSDTHHRTSRRREEPK